MGKSAAEEGQENPNPHRSVSNSAHATGRPQIRCGCGWILRSVSLKCVAVLVLSFAGLLSALFWLPPFIDLGGRHDLDLDRRFRGHDIVASFYVGKPESLLKDNIMQLEDDIFGEMNAPTIKVVVLSIEPVLGKNISKVYFAVDPDANSRGISTAAQSLIRASFQYLVTRQVSLRLTASLFGDPFSFEVEKFRAGITIVPAQSAFLLQKVQIYFNFTLNFSIEQIQDSFHELTSQLKSGLHLSYYENLYISLSNVRGSTVDAPTIVQSSVLLAVGAQPSMPRLKQLAQTITGNSHSRNLGLNNTIFGKVKQVRLSSILQHSLHGGDGAPSSSPAPQPIPHHHHHHHHQHHHHHHSGNPPLVPAMPPTAPAQGRHSPTWRKVLPAPQPSPSHTRRKHVHAPAPSIAHKAKPPGCRYTQKGRAASPAPEQSHLKPSSPARAPRSSVAQPPTEKHKPPARSVPMQGPIPHKSFHQAQPPSKSKADSALSDSAPFISPSPYSSSSCQLSPIRWAFLLLIVLVVHQ